jgi:hypothetical protein
MFNRPYGPAVLFVAFMFVSAAPAAAQGEITITHAKILAGDVTDNDDPGYPAKLTKPGSYILASNLSPGKDLDGIVVAAPDVSIDLNGFTISGGSAGGVDNARYGIQGNGDRLTVKNGTIGAFKGAGIYAPNRPYLIVEHMRIINGRGFGINNSTGNTGRIQNNTIATNLKTGIVCGRSCLIEGNVVSYNGTGIRAQFSTILGNTITFNAGYGIETGLTTSAGTYGFGNNVLTNNNGGTGEQVDGNGYELEPNYCSVGGC